MSNQFNRSITIEEILAIVDGQFSGNLAHKVYSISDSEKSEEKSICDYIKGPLPEVKPGLILLTNDKIKGYESILVEKPRLAIAKIIAYVKNGVGFKQRYSKVHNDVEIGKNVVLEENVEIGEGTIIQHNVVIFSGTRIGKNCFIGANSSIGIEGYNFIRGENSELVRQPHIGGVYIEDNVEIGSSTCISRGLVNNTYIGTSAKIDNLVHIAHDCNIGREALIIASSSLSGYVSIGQNARVAPNSTIRQRLKVGDKALVGIGSTVLKDIQEDMSVFGNPARGLKR